MESKHQHIESNKLGKRAEDAVRIALIHKGFREIARNFSAYRLGELDLVFLKEETIYIVEVRYRKEGGSFGGPEDSIGPLKRKRIYVTAKYFIAQHGLSAYDVTFLAACVHFSPEKNRYIIRMIPF